MAQNDEDEDFYETKDNKDNTNLFKKKRFSMDPQLKDFDSSYGPSNFNSPKKNSGKAVDKEEMKVNRNSNEYSYDNDYSEIKNSSIYSGSNHINSSSNSIEKI